MGWFASIFKAGQKEISSKRVCGVAGWFVILFIFVYACIAGKAIPEMGELMLASCALLGADTVKDTIIKATTKEAGDEGDA